MADFAAYALARALTQQAITGRNTVNPDQWGASDAVSYEQYLTVPCRLYWARSETGSSENRTYVDVSRQVSVSKGGILVPLGTDVLVTDQILQVNEWNPVTGEWELDVAGPIEVLSVVAYDSHLELAILRTQTGA